MAVRGLCFPLARLGMPFSPVMPIFAALLGIAMFYVKMLCLLKFGMPPKQLFSSSSLTTFFLLVALFTLAATAAPIAWAMARMVPSCGPFFGVPYFYPYQVMESVVDSTGPGFASVVYFFTSWGFALALILGLTYGRAPAPETRAVRFRAGSQSSDGPRVRSAFVGPAVRRVALYWVSALNRHRRKRVQELEEEVTAVRPPCRADTVVNAARALTRRLACAATVGPRTGARGQAVPDAVLQCAIDRNVLAACRATACVCVRATFVLVSMTVCKLGPRTIRVCMHRATWTHMASCMALAYAAIECVVECGDGSLEHIARISELAGPYARCTHDRAGSMHALYAP